MVAASVNGQAVETTQYLRILRRWWWLLLTTTFAGGIMAYIASATITPTYRASSTLVVVQQQTPGIIARDDIETSSMLASTFRGMITVRPLLENAIARGQFPLTPDALRQSLTVENPRSSQLLVVSARASDPILARDIVNVVSDVFINSDELALTSSVGKVSVIEPAVAPHTPISPKKPVNAILGASLALVATTMLVLLFEYLDDTVKSAAEAQEVTGLPTLGMIEGVSKSPQPAEQLRAALNPTSLLAESYRTLRSNLVTVLARRPIARAGSPVVLFTESHRGDGKTTAVANLAVMYGLAGYRTLLVDADLRLPSLHRLFGLENRAGLATLLQSEREQAASLAQPTRHANLDVLPSGPAPLNPSELLASQRMRGLLADLGAAYDLILLDGAPLSGLSDSLAVASMADGTVIVARSGKTRAGDVSAAVEQLYGAAAPVLGVVLCSSRIARGRDQSIRVIGLEDRDAARPDREDPPARRVESPAGVQVD